MEVKIDKNSLVNLSNSILKDFNIEPFHQTIGEVDKILSKSYQNIVILLCDGMGSENLSYHLDKNSFLLSHKQKNLHSVFPPTTTAATTSLLTGKFPSEHNWLGWDMYFKDTDEVISLYLDKVKGTNKSPNTRVKERNYMNFLSLVDIINQKTNHKAYYAYPFDENYPCKNLDEVIKRIEKLTQGKGKKFIYAYIEEPDKTMHHYGIYSKRVKEKIENINKKIGELSKRLKDTLLIVVADHGLTNSKYINLKKDFPDIFSMLKRETTIESRALGMTLKDNIAKDIFEKKINKYFKDDFILYKIDEVLEKKLFGPNINNNMKDFIGDYLLVATSNKSIIYNELSPAFKANHAGLTNKELLIPLIMIECKK